MPINNKLHNPDVLNCLANLSNDQIFTPPDLVNVILDDLEKLWSEDNAGKNIWEDKSIRFLDPCTKSGVFLREIAKRLINGLEEEFPELENRVEHVLTNQIFGIPTYELTSQVSRRTLYCSVNATGEKSVVSSNSKLVTTAIGVVVFRLAFEPSKYLLLVL